MPHRCMRPPLPACGGHCAGERAVVECVSMQGKTLLIVPTYDERDNVGPIAKAALAAAPDADILFVDDD